LLDTINIDKTLKVSKHGTVIMKKPWIFSLLALMFGCSQKAVKQDAQKFLEVHFPQQFKVIRATSLANEGNLDFDSYSIWVQELQDTSFHFGFGWSKEKQTSKANVEASFRKAKFEVYFQKKLTEKTGKFLNNSEVKAEISLKDKFKENMLQALIQSQNQALNDELWQEIDLSLQGKFVASVDLKEIEQKTALLDSFYRENIVPINFERFYFKVHFYLEKTDFENKNGEIYSFRFNKMHPKLNAKNELKTLVEAYKNSIHLNGLHPLVKQTQENLAIEAQKLASSALGKEFSIDDSENFLRVDYRVDIEQQTWYFFFPIIEKGKTKYLSYKHWVWIVYKPDEKQLIQAKIIDKAQKHGILYPKK